MSVKVWGKRLCLLLLPIAINLLYIRIGLRWFLSVVNNDSPIIYDSVRLARIAVDVVFILLSVFIFYKLKELEIFKPKWKIRHFIYLGLSFLLLFYLQHAVSFLRGQVSYNQQSIDYMIASSQGEYFAPLFLLSTCITGPIIEELICRGLVMRTFFKDSRYGLDIVASGLVFCMGHILGLPWSVLDFLGFFIGGMVFAGLFRLTKSIVYPILLHVIWNSFLSWNLILTFIYFNIF